MIVNSVRRKRVMLVLLISLLVVFSSALLHKVYAGKPTISLNSPVSFPVDI